MVLKNQQKITKANGMHSLPTWPTQVMLRENVGTHLAHTGHVKGKCGFSGRS